MAGGAIAPFVPSHWLQACVPDDSIKYIVSVTADKHDHAIILCNKMTHSKYTFICPLFSFFICDFNILFVDLGQFTVSPGPTPTTAISVILIGRFKFSNF